MHLKNNVICPNLTGSLDGVACSIVNEFIRNRSDADIRFCMNKRYEACSIYKSSLKRMTMSHLLSEAASETGSDF